ncbi:hypothetical protein N7519_002651 [Penicillium mononematosum]|uniref:uncharacterized protein n=1 Tax=Penicillium mononematosum TaxID=268346 RepID=UPI00254904CD|nr:uncharacterized protein N7519_002651 [Penicillium mononematosum]KAJ6187743.1 hypothetical protein N7519_002651 [Penicillium mononematosum]
MESSPVPGPGFVGISDNNPGSTVSDGSGSPSLDAVFHSRLLELPAASPSTEASIRWIINALINAHSIAAFRLPMPSRSTLWEGKHPHARLYSHIVDANFAWVQAVKDSNRTIYVRHGTPIGLLTEIDQHVQASADSPHVAELCRSKPTTPLRYDGLKHAQSEHVLPNGVTILGDKSIVNELADTVNTYDIWATEGNSGLVDTSKERWMEILFLNDLAEPRRTRSEERPERLAHYGVPTVGFEAKKTDVESDVAQALGYTGYIHRERKNLPKRDCTVYGMASNWSWFAFLKFSHDSKVSFFKLFKPNTLTSTSGQSTLSVRGGNFKLPLGIPVYMLRRAIMSPTHSKESSGQSHTQEGSDEINQAFTTVDEDIEMEQ